MQFRSFISFSLESLESRADKVALLHMVLWDPGFYYLVAL